MQCFYILCLLIYGTNPTQITPMHTIQADVVGGSHTLIKTLNRLEGLCSTDTHDCFVAQVAEKQQQKTVWDDIPSNVFFFTIASADILQCHASVYCGDQKRSYHGTTLQVVRPDPQLYIGESQNAGLSGSVQSQTLNVSHGDLGLYKGSLPPSPTESTGDSSLYKGSLLLPPTDSHADSGLYN